MMDFLFGRRHSFMYVVFMVYFGGCIQAKEWVLAVVVLLLALVVCVWGELYVERR